MQMSSKTRFALNALVDLALREAGGPVALASISQRQRVSLSYLEQMFSRLRRDGIVESTRGPGGGYTLARPADEISVADISRAVSDPPEVATDPLIDPAGALAARLTVTALEHMATITLASLLQEQIRLGAVVTPRPLPPRVPSARPVVKALRSSAPNSVFAFGRSFAA